MELKEEEVLLERTQGEENDVITDKTISEKSEEEMTAGLDEASAESAADNEPGFNTCRSMKAKSWNDQQRENCLLDAMMRAMETFQTACLPDAEAYQQFCRTWKDVRMPRGTKTTKRSIIVIKYRKITTIHWSNYSSIGSFHIQKVISSATNGH
ncbi:hypothetical protein Tcan_03923 [Toxocara canis]|uniref:Uncharacterized protein n=1 Tax=Toxocara canis TaxID=6265 RepID=A0A0B2VVE7_TOXCA|nr:hypothetical protein Tcan_03923 [Toxocara canis]